MAMAQVVLIYKTTLRKLFQVCAIQESEVDIVDDCAVPNYNAQSKSELPACSLALIFIVSQESITGCSVLNQGIQKMNGIIFLVCWEPSEGAT